MVAAPPDDVSGGALWLGGGGLGVDDDDRRSDLCPLVQRGCLCETLESHAAVAVPVAGGVLRAVVDALTAAERHEVGHLDVVQGADLAHVLSEDPIDPTPGRPRARTIACAVDTLGTMTCRHLHDGLVVLQGNQLPRLDADADDLAVLAVVVPAHAGNPAGHGHCTCCRLDGGRSALRGNRRTVSGEGNEHKARHQ